MQSVTGRWFGVGHSTAPDSGAAGAPPDSQKQRQKQKQGSEAGAPPDSRRAGAEATATALDGRTPQAVFVFASATHDLPALLEGVRAEAGPHTTVVGGTTLGELSSAGGSTRGGVVVTALGGDGFEIRTRLAYVGGNGHREAGAEAAGAMTGINRPWTTLMLLCEGMSGNPHEIVRGAYSVLGAAVPLVGGLTGRDHGGSRSYQFYEDRVVSGAVVGVGIGSDAPLGVGIGHGWHRTEPPMVITRSDGCTILELDGEPALDVLLRRRGLSRAEELFTASTRLEAFGLSRRSGEDIRVINQADAAARSLTGLATMPQGAICWLMESDHDALIAGAGQSCAEAVDGLGGHPPIGMFTFDCGGRRVALGEAGLPQEVATIRNTLGDVPFGGCYTMGEIARVRGSLGTHALTLVTLALA